MQAPRHRSSAGVIAAISPALTSLVCLLHAIHPALALFESSQWMVTVFFVQPLIAGAYLVYAESLKVEGSRGRRLLVFLGTGAVLLLGLFGTQKNGISFITHPDIALGLAWAVLGLVIALLQGKEDDRPFLALQAQSQAADIFAFWGMTAQLTVVIGIAMAIVLRLLDWDWPPERLAALVPAAYFATQVGCTWRVHQAAFRAKPQAWAEGPAMQRLERIFRFGRKNSAKPSKKARR